METAKLTDKENSANKSINPKEMVRTDCTEQKLEKFFGAPTRKNEDVAEKDQDESMIIEEDMSLLRNESFENKLLNKTVNNNNQGLPEEEKIMIEESSKTVKSSLISRITKLVCFVVFS